MTKRPILYALAIAVFTLGSAAALKWAAHVGILSDDLARRCVQVIIGLWLALYGNLMPKNLRGTRSLEAGRSVQAALRIGGYAFTLAGLAYAGLWAFAPLPVADIMSIVIVGAAMLLTMGFAGRAFLACGRRAPTRES